MDISDYKMTDEEMEFVCLVELAMEMSSSKLFGRTANELFVSLHEADPEHARAFAQAIYKWTGGAWHAPVHLLPGNQPKKG